MAAFPDVRIVPQYSTGIAAARQLALHVAVQDGVSHAVFMDDDIQIKKMKFKKGRKVSALYEHHCDCWLMLCFFCRLFPLLFCGVGRIAFLGFGIT